MKILNPEERLDSVWGEIESTHHQLVINNIQGRRVLDVGSGYGSMVNALQKAGFDAIGIDPDVTCVDCATKRFPSSKFIVRSAENDLSDMGVFDTVVCKDSFHHLVGESDIHVSLSKIVSILPHGGRMIVVDPNPCFILRLCRRIIRHLDVEVSPSDCMSLLEAHGFQILHIEYFETIGIALSGGYVGPQLVPSWPWSKRILRVMNELFSSLVNWIGLGRFICWRYICIAQLHCK